MQVYAIVYVQPNTHTPCNKHMYKFK
jgi:hypothetical protein